MESQKCARDDYRCCAPQRGEDMERAWGGYAEKLEKRWHGVSWPSAHSPRVKSKQTMCR